MIQRYEVWEDNYYKCDDGDWCNAQDALLQDVALDVLAKEFSDITPCNNCPCIKRCQDTDEDCVSLLKAYAFEEARRRMG